jgi:MoaA/NifB/PqqE/SkfB family radical SAM enzyme
MRLKAKIVFKAGLQFIQNEVIRRILLGLRLPANFVPSVINAKVTLDCNLRCRQCSIWQKDSGTHLTTGEWKKIILDMKNYVGLYFLRFYGGEPFCRADLLDIINFCSRNEISCLITTNGTYIDGSVARELIRNRLTLINISLDGMRPETHDRLRGVDGTYRKVMCAIELLQGKIPIQINTTIMEENLDEIIGLAEFSLKNKIQISFQGVLNFDKYSHTRCGFIPDGSPLFPKSSEKTSHVLDELIARKKRYNFAIVNNVTQLENLKLYYQNSSQLKRRECGALRNNQPTVKEKGDFFLCALHKPIGNLVRSRLREVWDSKHAAEIRSQMSFCDVQACAVLRGYCHETIMDIVREIKRDLWVKYT